jgi:hypothetical protein
MVNLTLGFPPRARGNTNGTLTSAASSTSKVSLPFAVDQTKKRLIKWLNLNLVSSAVTAKIYITRTHADGTTSETQKMPLSQFQTAEDFQANKVTIDTSLYLDDGDVLNLDLLNSSASAVVTSFVANYDLV